jgi:hypothetical protein
MTEYYDKKWNMNYEKLVKFKRTNGHCMVPRRYEQDKSLGEWVSKQRKVHNNNTIRLDRKRILDQIGFAWKADAAHQFKPDDKLWLQQHEKLVEYKRINGNCKVPRRYEQDKSLGEWVTKQRGRFITTIQFDLIEREFWTKSGSLGKLTPPTNSMTSSGTSNMNSWSNINESIAI